MTPADPGPAPSVRPRSGCPSNRSKPPSTLTAARERPEPPLVPPELVAQTLREYLHGAVQRIRGGESGMLPVIMGLIIIADRLPGRSARTTSSSPPATS